MWSGFNFMKAFQILYRTASGPTKLTGAIVCGSAAEALNYTTNFVRANYVATYEVHPPNQRNDVNRPYNWIY
jgi:hypothetical protein